MEFEKLKWYLRHTRAVLKEVCHDTGQDPFVLYENRYKLVDRTFGSWDEMGRILFCESSGFDKEIAVKSCEGEWRLKYWVQKSPRRPSEVLKKKQK